MRLKKLRQKIKNKTTAFVLFGWKIWFNWRQFYRILEWKLTYRLKLKWLHGRKLQQVTHIYAHLATDALVVAFAPAFPFVAQRQESSRKSPTRIVSGVRWHSKKRKKTDLLLKNLWRTVRFFSTFWLFCNDRIYWISWFCSADNSSQIFEGRNWTYTFQTVMHNDWNP